MIYPNTTLPENWIVKAPNKYTIEGSNEYHALFSAAASNLGFDDGTILEYYMNLWVFYNSGQFKTVPENVIRAVELMRVNHAPHVILKMYRLQNGLETP